MENNNSQTVNVNNNNNLNGMATASLVIGIIGLVMGIIPFLGWFFMPLWILAVVFGGLGMKKEEKRGLAITGLVLGLGTFAYKIGFWLLIAAF